ncbi:MAG: aminotransferase class I/II-fold pyridoxal phosphate-dependent enzyme [Proteobacteria bacterium]|nr:aminotransferase class I/II-fold pyridoxal phosphate-dependent enzyme [Pseudomonadota bacterium]
MTSLSQAQPPLSDYFSKRTPSAIRVATIRFAERRDGTEAINVAIGNVSLPMHPAMMSRMQNLGGAESPFREGVVRYTATVGTDEATAAFLNIIASSGFDVSGLHCQVTDGGSQAMELVIVGCCGAAGSGERPLMLIDPAYTNYGSFAERVGRSTVSIRRTLQDDGRFTLPALSEIDAAMAASKPGALVVIPYDNPTGHAYDQSALEDLARLCVKHDIWMVSDEAYRELHYTGSRTASIWAVTDERVPGIVGRRISIESASKVWNACGLRIGALVTDNRHFHTQAVAENTAGLCSSAIGQHIFGALGHVSHDDLRGWYGRQRDYYKSMLDSFTASVHEHLPGAVVSRPDAALYSIVDVRALVDGRFDALDFVMFCATEGAVDVDGKRLTLLTAPMSGFYETAAGEPNPGRTQMRVAYVETPERMALVPRLLAALFRQYISARNFL